MIITKQASERNRHFWPRVPYPEADSDPDPLACAQIPACSSCSCYADSFPSWLAAPARRARASSQQVQVTGMPLRFAAVFSATSAESLSPRPVVTPSVRLPRHRRREGTQCKEATWAGISTVPLLSPLEQHAARLGGFLYSSVSVLELDAFRFF